MGIIKSKSCQVNTRQPLIFLNNLNLLEAIKSNQNTCFKHLVPTAPIIVLPLGKDFSPLSASFVIFNQDLESGSLKFKYLFQSDALEYHQNFLFPG